MDVDALQERIEQLFVSLRAFSGHRSLWLGRDGRVWHTEPDDDLRAQGGRYVTTLMRPSREELAQVLLLAVSVIGPEPARVAGLRADGPAAYLAPVG